MRSPDVNNTHTKCGVFLNSWHDQCFGLIAQITCPHNFRFTETERKTRRQRDIDRYFIVHVLHELNGITKLNT